MFRYSVTLIYADTTTWFAGEFLSQEEAQAWIDTEKTRPYWSNETEVHIVETEHPDVEVE